MRTPREVTGTPHLVRCQVTVTYTRHQVEIRLPLRETRKKSDLCKKTRTRHPDPDEVGEGSESSEPNALAVPRFRSPPSSCGLPPARFVLRRTSRRAPNRSGQAGFGRLHGWFFVKALAWVMKDSLRKTCSFFLPDLAGKDPHTASDTPPPLSPS